MNPLFRFLFLLLALCPLTLSANPLLFAQLEARLVTHLYKGKVMTRAQVVGDSGGPILVKVRSSGDSESVETEEVATIGEVYPGGSLDGAYVLSGAEYSYFLKLYQRLKQEQPGKLGRAVFLSRAQLESGVPLADGGHSQTVNLPDDIKTVLVLGQSERFGESPSGWTLMEVPFQMDEGTHLEEGVSSVLLKANGEVHKLAYGSRDEGGAFSIETFTYRVAYYGKGEDALKQSEERREFSDRVFGPVAGQVLSTDQSGTLSNPDGVYTMLEVRPCVGINIGGEFVSGFTMEQLLVLEVAASTGSVFNPEGKTHLPLFISKLVPFICHNNARRTYTRDFVVDTLWLTGKMRLANEESGPAIPIGGEMRYQAQSQAGALTAQNHYDFDGDGEPDRALLANKVEREDDAGNTYVVPEAAPDGDWQAVYFSSGSKSPNAEDVANRVPDVWRLPDRTLPGEDSQHTGLLKQISRDAMISTDLYIFRESTGEMIVEVNGLPIGTGNADWRLDTEENTYTWNTIMRGPRQYAMTGGVCHSGQRGASCLLNTLYDGSGDSERGLLADRGEDAVRASNEQLGYSSRYRGRDSGLPAPGEQLYAVAINRATGYVGTARFKLGNISSGEGLENGTITQQVPDITLTPPRLQIWARRLSNIESGLTRGQNVQYLIGHEGAATKDDTIVGIYTRWMGSEGRPFPASIPLPEGLGSGHGEHYGLTGRLNKISGGQLTPATAGRSLDGLEVNLSDSEQKDCAQRDTEYEEEQCLETYRLSQATDKAKGAEMTAEFPIAPGQQLQLVQLPNDLSKNQHFYVTVYGRPLSKEAMPRDPFDATGDQTGLLSGRPNLYTPFYVPRYDEAATLEEQLIRNQQDNETDDDTTSGSVPPQYRWMQRPEYQFSLVDLTIEEINAVGQTDNPDGSTSENLRNLLDNDVPVVTSGDDLVRIMYELLGPDSDPLPSVDGDREYVFAFGENEVRATYTEEGELEFENLEHLNQLSTEDYLTARLYLNHDPENVLWQWAFGKNGFHVDFEYPGNEFGLTARQHPNLNTQETGYFILGGARVRMSFGFPKNSIPIYLEIRSNVPGRTCDDFYSDPASGCTTMTSTNYQILEQTGPPLSPLDLSAWETYWEPINPSGGNDWQVSLDGTLLVKAAYITATGELISYGNVDAQLPSTLPPEIYRVEYPILRQKLWNRTLQPRPASQTAMQGDDVKILEAMLWQLGYGPNDGQNFTKGNSSIRKASDRDIFDIGCSVGGCSTNNGATTSMEWMAWRFKYANEVTIDANVTGLDVTLVDTHFDSNALVVLKEHWQDYLEAYSDYATSQTVTAQNQLADFANWLNASAGWQLNGNSIYTPVGVTRSDLLNAMVSKESGTATRLNSGIHWGSGGNNTTPYRLNQGSADSWASFGFSQIKSRYIYGQRYGGRNGAHATACTELNAHNPYSPDGAIASIVEYSMGGNGSCGRSFRYALDGIYTAHYTQNDQARIVKILGDSPRVIPESDILVLDDGYDAVSKAIGAYNQGASRFDNIDSWPELIKIYSGATFTDRTDVAIQSAIGYARRVKQTAGFTLRDYVWRVTENRTPTAGWPVTEFSYCFTFGESHWGQLWIDARNAARTTTISTNGGVTGCP